MSVQRAKVGDVEKQRGVCVQGYRDLGNDEPYMMTISCPLTRQGHQGPAQEVTASSNTNHNFPTTSTSPAASNGAVTAGGECTQ